MNLTDDQGHRGAWRISTREYCGERCGEEPGRGECHMSMVGLWEVKGG